MSQENVCPNCMAKEMQEISTLKNYIENNTASSIDDISYETGISQKNLYRFISYDDFKGYNFKG